MPAIRIDFFFNSRVQAFLAASCDEAERTVAKLKGRGMDASVAFHESNEDGELQVRQVRQRVETFAQSVAGEEHLLLILPIKLQALEFIARSIVVAAPDRTGWVFLHQEVPEKVVKDEPGLRERLIWSVAADQELMGELQARQVQRLFPHVAGAGQVGVVYLQGPIHSSATYRRTKGFKRQLAETPHIGLLTQMLYGEWTRESARRALVAGEVHRLERFTRVAAAHNDDMALGIRDHYRERGRADLPCLGMDGLDALGKAKVDEGELLATVVQPLGVQDAIWMFLKRVAPEVLAALETKPVPDVRPCETVPLASTSYPPLESLAPRSS
jgi:hypothetical protein